MLKGTAALDWGMQNRLAQVFRPATSRTVMLAIDHGYFQGPTTGLERVEESIVPLLPYADALITTRGMVRSTIPPASRTPIVLRASGGARRPHAPVRRHAADVPAEAPPPAAAPDHV